VLVVSSPAALPAAAGIWKLLGKLTDQQTGIIEERLKTVDKDLARRGLAPGHRAAASASSRATDSDAAGEGLGSRGGSQRATEGGGVGASALRHLQADAAAAAAAAGPGPGSAAAAEQWRSGQGCVGCFAFLLSCLLSVQHWHHVVGFFNTT
jgi:hypothetical protein